MVSVLRSKYSQGIIAYGMLGILLLVEMIAICVRTGTPAFFTLDDPYIHLALAESIAHGGYGINPGEYASPSSSILYPFLLAPFAAFGVGEWGALALNVMASFGILAVWRKLLIRFGFSGDGMLETAMALLATLAVNGVALVFTGMEHTLHIFCTLVTMLAIIDVAEGKTTPWFLIPIAFAGALLRYEGGAIAGAAALVLLWSGRWRQAALLIALVAIAYAGFSFFLYRLGLPILPSSVLVKSDSASMIAGEDGLGVFIRSILSHAKHNVTSVHVVMLLAGLYCMTVVYYRRAAPASESRLTVTLFALAVLAAHLVAFRSGWFYRYEPYAVGVLLVWILYSHLSGIARPISLHLDEHIWTWFGGFVVLLVFAASYVVPVAQTATAARNIFEQQYQMHRFVTEFWKAPVAVNDLGWVAYRNPDYVLDLRGLGFARARIAFEKRDAGWFEDAAAAKRVEIAMIYKSSFQGAIPPRWDELAVLRLGSPRITPKEDRVSFYLTDPAARDRATKALDAFAATLPEGVALVKVATAVQQQDIPGKD